MCGGGAPADNSHVVAQIEADRAREVAAAEAAKRAQDEQRFTSSLNSAYQSAIADAEAYFSSMGLDPSQYAGAIANFANSQKGSVPFLDQAPGTYFTGLGENVYTREQEAARSKALRDIRSFANDGFDRNLIRDDADDPFIASLIEEQYLDNQRRLEGQVARGTLTDFGLSQSMKDLQRQRSTAGTSLEALTSALLETGRGGLRETASFGKTAANNLMLGDVFDPFNYERQINEQATDFLGSLGDRVRGIAPNDLFDLGSAFQYGGQRQGVQATGFDPSASAGIFSFFNDEEEKKKKSQVENVF